MCYLGHDKTTPGRHNKRRHNLIVFRVQTESTGKVAAMVMLVLSVNQNDCALETNCKYVVVSNVVQKGIRARSHREDMRNKMAHPFVRVFQGPT